MPWLLLSLQVAGGSLVVAPLVEEVRTVFLFVTEGQSRWLAIKQPNEPTCRKRTV
jgi:hypothetical protein